MKCQSWSVVTMPGAPKCEAQQTRKTRVMVCAVVRHPLDDFGEAMISSKQLTKPVKYPGRL